MTGLAGAIRLMTRVPVPAAGRERFDPGRAVPWFPVVGAAVGVVVAVSYVALVTILPTFLAAVLAAAAGSVTTGAFHEDGLGDVADAFVGGMSPERRLEILDDPDLGTFGVLAVTIALLARVGSIAALDAWSAVALLPAAHAVSQVGGIVLMRRVPVAKRTGLAAGYAAAVTPARVGMAVFSAALISALLLGIWSIGAFAISGVVALIAGRLAKSKIGGITGDVLGATQQVSEVAILLMGVVVLHERWAPLVWWTT